MDKLLCRIPRIGMTVVARRCHSAAVKKANKEDELAALLHNPPTSCCGSACNNCVWIAYAEELSKLCRDGGDQAKSLIEQNVSDPCLKAFLLTELRFKLNQ